LQDVIDELRMLAGFGYKEIVLAGIRLGSYAGGLASLIRVASEVEGIERIRLSSIEIWEIDDDLLCAMAESPKVCRHLHVPLQSGSAEVLEGMRRPYTPQQYAEVIDKARQMLPELSLTTDVIVGFPGESEEQFERSYRFVQDTQFSRLHVFRYSARKGTAAAEMLDHVPEWDKTLRSEKMIELGTELAHKFAFRLVGRTIPVLVESKRAELLSGFTDNYVEVQFAGSERLRGTIQMVRIDSISKSGTLYGSILNNKSCMRNDNYCRHNHDR
jgi:threonylcarbamoyladenosine tRNA methylthiotransferase MtaB